MYISIEFALFVAMLGAVIGSFLSALTYRLSQNISIKKGRSFCPNCKVQIAWHDNIPLISYVFLGGRCRNCKKRISARYPLIEASTSILFVASYIFYSYILLNLPWLALLGWSGLAFILATVALLAGVFVVDLEHQIIPDEFVFAGLSFTVLALLVSGSERLFVNLLSGALSASFLLSLHLLTKSRGMGLGDVKLALFIGTLLGPLASFFWLLTSFVLGSVVGVVLISASRARLKSKIAFGPFLVVSCVLLLFLANRLTVLIFPFW